MKYEIFQLPTSHNNCFMGSMFKLDEIKLVDYVHVYTGKYDGEINGAALENIFELLNVNHPADYHARSLSVSDIICVHNNGDLNWYYVDSFGFKKLNEKEIG